MKLQTVRLRRSRPSALSLALALLITMAFVYILSLSAQKPESDAANHSAPSTAELRLEGLDVAFVREDKCETLLQARISAANCIQRGGAGLVMAEADGIAVIHEAVSPADAPEASLLRSAPGITLKISGPADEIAALSEAVSFLRAQATETAGLAPALERGDTDAKSMAALTEIYKTQAQKTAAKLAQIEGELPAVQALQSALQAAQTRLNTTPTPASLRMLHAGACGEWLTLLENLAGKTQLG